MLINKYNLLVVVMIIAGTISAQNQARDVRANRLEQLLNLKNRLANKQNEKLASQPAGSSDAKSAEVKQPELSIEEKRLALVLEYRKLRASRKKEDHEEPVSPVQKKFVVELPNFKRADLNTADLEVGSRAAHYEKEEQPEIMAEEKTVAEKVQKDPKIDYSRWAALGIIIAMCAVAAIIQFSLGGAGIRQGDQN